MQQNVAEILIIPQCFLSQFFTTKKKALKNKPKKKKKVKFLKKKISLVQNKCRKKNHIFKHDFMSQSIDKLIDFIFIYLHEFYFSPRMDSNSSKRMEKFI